ncbi:MAG: Phospholipase D [Chlamydiae bacterium]|nr:Phospholipase D [Chlamydiota bacterium]
MFYRFLVSFFLLFNVLFSTEVYFSNEHDVIQKLTTLIDQEESKIEMVMYTLTHTRIVRALVDAKKRGVDVIVMIDPFTAKISKPKLEMLKKGNVDIYVFDPKTIDKPTWYHLEPLCHHKFFTFKSLHTVWTGSFNATYGASVANLENVVVLDSKKVFTQFSTYFKKILSKHTRSYP